MEALPRCKKCRRILKSAASIARGMGSKCAGVSFTSGKTFHSRIRGRSGSAYQSTGGNASTGLVLPNAFSAKCLRKRADISHIKAERRKLFDERKPFQCGVLTRTHTPLIYVPAGDSAWKENHSGRTIPHETLQNYLKRYNLT